MIIKSLTRKKGSFKQLMKYINKDADDLMFLRNFLLPLHANEKDILEVFEKNHQLAPKHQTAVAIHHDIVSIKLDKYLPVEAQKAILLDLTYQYLYRKAPHQLTYARLHCAPHHLHFHLIIAANLGDQRNRLSKARFKEIQLECEKYLHNMYPQMKLSNPPLFYEPEIEQEIDMDLEI